ncbi:MAG: hypothetical protein DI601_13920 [Azospirillum brasilense]|nr:MAG: hypothetical protein DI601_13920 [Azospirillum brasilense]
MGVKVSVICTGQLRDPFEFGIIMTRLLNLREQGRIDQLILSSWKDDLIASPEVLTALRRAGFQVVLSDLPVVPGPGVCWFQKRQLAAGLQLVEPGSVVAKVRTDKCAHLIERVVLHANQRRETIADEPTAGAYRRQVSATNIVTNWVLSHSDFTFVGLREDLSRMTVCDNTDAAWVGSGPVAEVEWYHGALRGVDPVTDQWMRHLDAGLLARSLTKMDPKTIDREALAALWPIFARAWVLTNTHYRILYSAPFDEAKLPRDLPLALLNGQVDMAPRDGLALIGPKVKVGNAAMAKALSAHSAILEGATQEPDSAKVSEALRILLGPAAPKAMTGSLSQGHLPMEGIRAAPHMVMLRAVFGAAADSVGRVFPGPTRLNELARGRDPDNALLAEAVRIGQEGASSGDEVKLRAAAEVLAMLTHKRHPPSLQALLALPKLEKFIDAERLQAIFQRAASFEPKVWDLVKERKKNNADFASIFAQRAEK